MLISIIWTANGKSSLKYSVKKRDLEKKHISQLTIKKMALIDILPKSEIEDKESTNVTVNFLSNTLRSILFTPSLSTGKESDIDKKLNQISLAEVEIHDSFNDCWVVIYDRVYDISEFLMHVSKYLERQHLIKILGDGSHNRKA